MRANRLFTVATIAVLMGGTSLAVGQEQRGGASSSVQGGGSVQGGATQRGSGTVGQARSQGGSLESRGSDARGAQGPMRRTEMPRDRGSDARGAQGSERGRANLDARGRVEERGRLGENKGGRFNERGRLGANEGGRFNERGRVEERGRLGANERGRAEERGRLGANERGRFDERSRAETTGRASSSTRTDVGVNLSSEQRTRIHDMVFSRRDIPRVSNLDVDVRVNSVIPRSMRLAAVPEDVVRIYPRFRRDRLFVYNDEIVIVDPVTFRIVAVLPV